MKKSILTGMLLLALVTLRAQTNVKNNFNNRGPDETPEIINANIPGAPKLEKPLLIMAGDKPIDAKGNGIAAPAFYDWDKDGKKDLLVGEFLSGVEKGTYTGNFLRVYRNKGTNENPQFDGSFKYAFPWYKEVNNGTPLSVIQGCCMGFTPEFRDLNKDGHMDMITGQYQGYVTWFKGNENGFDAGTLLHQEGNPERDKQWQLRDLENPVCETYWLFSIASMGDFNGDGLDDLVTGGYTLRISLNTGTKEKPRFGLRKFLRHTDGQPLNMKNTLPTEYETENFTKNNQPVFHMVSPTVVDWDNDGVLDILAANHYLDSSMPAVMFFKGVKTKAGHRFEKGIELFTGMDHSKVLPGRWLHLSVTDWNNDGIKDLLIGTSVMTLHDYVFNGYLSWNWEHETGVQKYDPGLLSFQNHPGLEQQWVDSYMKQKATLEKIPASDYLTAKHCGYVYVMLGKK